MTVDSEEYEHGDIGRALAVGNYQIFGLCDFANIEKIFFVNQRARWNLLSILRIVIRFANIVFVVVKWYF